MGFCHECGNKVEKQDKFCPSCGTQLHTFEPTDEAKFYSTPDVCHARGILVTDSFSLSGALGCNQGEVKSLIQDYIKLVREYGVEYHILDCCNYTYQGGSYKGKSVSLNSLSNNFEDYIRLINDMYSFGFKEDNKPSFMFIVGSSKIVPMYKGVNYIYMTNSTFSDKDVDSDLPYCYIAPKDNIELMESGAIMAQQQKFHVGRLPIGEDWTIGTMTSYLKNALATYDNGGLNIDCSYGQIDPHWSIESDIVTMQLNKMGLFNSKSTSKGFAYNNLHTTPNVILDNVDRYFDTNASFLYFNMHGSRSPEAPQFFGYSVTDKRNGGGGISPKELSTLTGKNILISEACYGGKFDGLSSKNSMVLTALKSNTIAYIGSSRIALAGSVKNYTDTNAISFADKLANEFINNILAGNLVGAAFSDSKIGYLGRIDKLTHEDMLTLAEFNLFGDPALPINLDGYKDTNCKSSDYSDIIGYSSKEIYTAGSGSILSLIRGAVDKNIAQIRDSLNSYMSANFGIEARTLNNITKTTYKSGEEQLKFYYGNDSEDENGVHIAITNINGDIQQVLISK